MVFVLVNYNPKIHCKTQQLRIIVILIEETNYLNIFKLEIISCEYFELISFEFHYKNDMF